MLISKYVKHNALSEIFHQNIVTKQVLIDLLNTEVKYNSVVIIMNKIIVRNRIVEF